jgi:aminomethyltransferase
MPADTHIPPEIRQTPLYNRHVALDARMVPFAGYDMPVQYEGVLSEHKWTREHCGLFDVSHMGQARVSGAGAIATLEALTPSDFAVLKPHRQRYSLLLNSDGGIVDDWMVSRPDADGFILVVNAGCKDNDFKILQASLKPDTQLRLYDERALLALQGPKARDVMASLCPAANEMFFMDCSTFELSGELLGETVFISRSGYTGEDGFEISISATKVGDLWDHLLTYAEVKPIGLGARDSLRLEAGMPLYGHEMDESVSLVEADLGFGMSKSRLERGDILGVERIKSELAGDLKRVRVALRVLEGPPARDGAKIVDEAGTQIGVITSGVPSPSLGYSIAMGFVPPSLASLGARHRIEVRGKTYAAEIVKIPFVANGYHRKK